MKRSVKSANIFIRSALCFIMTALLTINILTPCFASTVDFSSACDIMDMSADLKLDSDDCKLFYFTVNDDCSYTFYCVMDDNCDANPYVTLYDNTYSQIAYSDNNGEDENFCLTYNYSGGTTYYFCVGECYGNECEFAVFFEEVDENSTPSSITFTPVKEYVIYENEIVSYSYDISGNIVPIYNEIDICENGNVLTLNYSSYSVEYVYCNVDGTSCFYNEDEGALESYLIKAYSSQTSQPWEAGTENKMYVEYNGLVTYFYVTLLQVSITDFTVTLPYDLYVYKNMDGEVKYDDYGVEYFCYDLPSIFVDGAKITLYYSNGDNEIYAYDSESDCFCSDADIISSSLITVESNQKTNHWDEDSDNYITVNYYDLSVQLPVEVNCVNVQSISFINSTSYSYYERLASPNDISFNKGDILIVEYENSQEIKYEYCTVDGSSYFVSDSGVKINKSDVSGYIYDTGEAVVIYQGSEYKFYPNITEYFYQDEFDFVIEQNTAKIVDYLGEESVVYIPSVLGECETVIIGENSFAGQYNVTDIIIPESVTQIESGAFDDCIRLNVVSIANASCIIDDSLCYVDTIIAPSSSTALEYANSSGKVFLELCEENNGYSHKEVTQAQIPADCENDGTASGTYCACCGKKLSGFETIKATGHSYTTTVVAPTCTEKGYTLHSCKNCTYSYKDTYVNATSHTYTSKVTTAATCSKEGVRTYTCTCGASYTESIAKITHSYTTKVVAPTCEEKGYTLHSCKNCTYSYKDTYVNATGHNYTSKVTKKPTSKTKGKITYTCSCGDTYTESIAKLATTSIKKITAKSKGFKVTWKKKSSVTGYQVQYATNKKFTKNKKTITIKKKSTTSKTVKKLKAKKKYYVRVRTYKTINGKKYYSSWSKTKTVTTKK